MEGSEELIWEESNFRELNTISSGRQVGIGMEGSEELIWEESNFRELNTISSGRLPNFSELNTISSGRLGVLGSNNRLGVSRDASNNTVGIQANGINRKQSSTYNSDNHIGSSGVCGAEVEADVRVVCGLESVDISLRQWLDKPERSVDLLECLHIFRQIVEMVNNAHSQSIVVHNVRPSCFIMSSFNHVSFIESASCSSLGPNSFEDGEKGTIGSQNSTYCRVNHDSGVGEQSSSSPFPRRLPPQENRFESEDSQQEISLTDTFERAPKASQRDAYGGICGSDADIASCLQSNSAYATHLASIEDREKIKVQGRSREDEVEENKKAFPPKQIFLMELNWYTSPEEVVGDASSFSSDIYRLGVLLFELFCPFSSLEEKLRTMSNLRHRVLPPQLLLARPMEASFCLWLLHPQPNTRPKMSEVLQSKFLSEPRDSLEDREAAMKLREKIEEKELLLEFLLQVQQKKEETADKLHDTIRFLSSDIEEVLKQQSLLQKNGKSYLDLSEDEHLAKKKIEPLKHLVREEDSTLLCSRKRFKPGIRVHSEDEFIDDAIESTRSETHRDNQDIMVSKTSRMMRNFKKLEAAYFSTRCRPIKLTAKLASRNSPAGSIGRGPTARTEGSNISSVDNLTSKEDQSEGRSGWVNTFLEGLCRYLSFSKLEVRADLKQGDLLNSSSLVCSLSFDRDREFFATAGVNKKIKIFEWSMILDEDLDIHYPVIEMASRSKLSSICWNSYIKSQIASSNFEGVVQVWDVTRSQVFVELREHERRVWSVDFSQADPTRLASGSDDGAVKLWNINQGGSVCTIKINASVCCVQFPPDSSRTLAIGSADHKIYCYDLRNTKIPWCTLMGHTKTVSYIKFIDSSTLVSASTDNSLKLWDLSMNTSRVIDTPVQTFTGHTNLKNFVGLSIADGYIATGSETNEVFVYHKAFPMPVLSYKFNNMDSLYGHEVDDMNQFISCVCWRGQSSTLVAANSTGNIKILEMV